MASPSLLDFPVLLAPVPGDNPAGGPVPFGIRDQLEQARQEVDPAHYAPDDPLRPEHPVKADWAGIIRLGQEVLTTTSKNLTIAARLADALAHQYGFAGARDGLRLLRLLVEQCWERLDPPLDDEDALEVRAGPFNWLSDADHGARFPPTLRGLPLVGSEGGRYGWQDWRRSHDDHAPVRREAFEMAIQVTPYEQSGATVADLDEAVEEVNRLEQLLAAKMGPAAPALSELRRALEDCRLLARQILQRKEPAAPPQEQAAGDSTPKAGAGAAGRGPATREDVYRRLAEAADLLQQLEPHSPIPYLVRRAVALGAMPFPQLIRELIREPNVLQELIREFGIQELPKGG
jgi:type VI secretion system protein ImpA